MGLDGGEAGITYSWVSGGELQPITQLESDGLQAGATLSSMMSILFIIYTVFTESRSGRLNQLSFPNKLIGYEIALNFVMCLATLAGRCGSIKGCNPTYCRAQGFMVQFSGLASHFWMGFVAWKMYQWIVLSKHEARLHKKLPSTFGFVISLALVAPIVMISYKKFGQCASWCWINGPADGAIVNTRMWGYYAYLISSWSINVIVLVVIALRRKVSTGAFHMGKRLALEGAVQNKLTLYIFVFSFCWFFSVLDFIIEYAYQNRSVPVPQRPIYFPSALMAAIFTPLHGFGNCLVFHGYLDWVIPWMTRTFPLCVRRLVDCLPFLAACCKPCMGSEGSASGAPGAERAERSKKFVVRRASASFTSPLAHKPKRTSVLDRFAIFASDAGASKGGKSPLSVPGAEHSHGSAGGPMSVRLPHDAVHQHHHHHPPPPHPGASSSPSSPSSSSSSSPPSSSQSRALANMGAAPRSGTPYVPQVYSIFVTTFNLGEAKLSSYAADLAEWIILGHDIYSIGVQECLDLGTVREAIHAHLGGPDEYKMFCTEIGSDNTNFGYHGFIALTVFVRTADFNAGRVRETIRATTAMATGQNLIITTAQNKGAVGIPFQIHDTSVAFLASHLPSDQKGASKLAKRNAAACTILKEVVLAPEDVDFDMHLQHDHVFFTGDMNYRMQCSADGPYLLNIVEACKAEKSVLGDDPQWLARKYSLLRSPRGDDLMYPKASERRLILAAKARSEDLWLDLLEDDELRMTMQRGDAFTGFSEELPAFPPTYKRTKAGDKGGSDGGCGDYTDLADFMRGFSHTGLRAAGVGAAVAAAGAGAVVVAVAARLTTRSRLAARILPSTATAAAAVAAAASAETWKWARLAPPTMPPLLAAPALASRASAPRTRPPKRRPRQKTCARPRTRTASSCTRSTTGSPSSPPWPTTFATACAARTTGL